MLIPNLKEFMERNRDRNRVAELTSILLSTESYYIHLIEGTRPNVQ
jgi:hypothetical protein